MDMSNKTHEPIPEYVSHENAVEYTLSQTNPRYPAFKQIVFTAGDEEQFMSNVSTENLSKKEPRITSERWGKCTQIQHLLSNRPTANSMIGMFRNLFHTTKKGIFVQIRNNKLITFLPFSKHNFDNCWGDGLRVSENFVSIDDLYRYSQNIAGFPYNPRKIQYDKNFWIGNGNIIRNSFPVREGDSNVTCLKHMFTNLLDSREIPDVDFFLNRRDFPIHRKDGKHPYPDLAGDKFPRYKVPENPMPVLSMCGRESYADVPIPTWDDWNREVSLECSRNEKPQVQFNTTYLGRDHRVYPDIYDSTPLVNKIPRAVFRGSTTGKGTTIETNIRLKLASMNSTSDLLDAGITSFNFRPRIVSRDEASEEFPHGRGVLDCIRKDSLDFDLVQPLTPKEQAGYRYVINVDGHVKAFRLSYEFSMGSCILLVDSKYHLWFSDYIKPYEHYVPVKEDLSDLIKQIEWCEQNLEKVQEIADNARKFYETQLTKEGIFDYLENLFSQMSGIYKNYTYNSICVKDLTCAMEKRSLGKFKSSTLSLNENWHIFDKIKSVSRQEVIYSSKSCTVGECKIHFGETTMETKAVIKYPVETKIKESLHEVFVRKVLEKVLLKHNDTVQEHLSGLFGYRDDGVSMWKYINGKTLFQYLVSEDITVAELTNIIKQIIGIMQILRETCNFSHGDLYPYNILLEKSGSIFSKTFTTSRGVIRCRGYYKVHIIDFGKSHIVYKGVQYGMIRPFYGSSILDTIMLVVSCASRILSKRVPKDILGWVFHFVSFLSDESYCPEELNTVGKIKKFLIRARKYTQMLYSDKGRLENLSPIDLLFHLDSYNYAGDREKLVEDKTLPVQTYPCFVFNELSLLSPEAIFKTIEKFASFDKESGIVIQNKFRIKTFIKYSRVILKLNLRNEIIDQTVYDKLIGLLGNLNEYL